MSADNWAICPQCNSQALAAKQKSQLDAGEAYGKVSAEEYLRLLAIAEKPPEMEETLREDYEIWIGPDGKFAVSYRGGCDKCGFEFNYEHSEKVKLKKVP